MSHGDDISSQGGGASWVSMVSMYCRGIPITASNTDNPGRSKAEAEGKALLVATAKGGTLDYFVGQKKMDEVRRLIDSSPAGHVAALHVPELPDEILDDLTTVLGSQVEHEERMAEHI